MWFRARNAGADRAHSLRRRLLLLVIAAVALASALQAASAYRTALRNADALFDAHLQAMARSVQGGGPFGPDRFEPDISVQIWREDGVLLFGAGRARLPGPAVIGFSDAVVDGVRYRVYTLAGPGHAVQIAQDLDERRGRARSLAFDAVWPVALLGLLLMLAVWAVIESSLAPVERLRRHVAARPADDLSPLGETGLPDELRPLVRDFDQLFARMREAMQAQQRFVADAAHELRSPLTALRLQAQALRRQEPGPAREAAAARLENGIARAIALVHQLLALAREESAERAARSDVRLEDLCREVVTDLLPLAQARRIDIGLEAGGMETAAVRGEPESLRTLLRNLVDNAVKYTPEGGRVDIVLERPPQSAGVVLAVEDSGPGIPEADHERVFDRFHRGAGEQDVPGSGLGLAIVAAVARRHGAQLRLGRSIRLGGLRVEVRFPAGP
jgi:two-component system, OmpR family, sensor kinase